jgi:hypothetical protein
VASQLRVGSFFLCRLDLWTNEWLQFERTLTPKSGGENLMREVIYAAAMVVLLAGCASRSRAPAGNVLLDDISVRGSGYRVTRVDGVPAQRAESALESVVPYVLLTPGEHTLSVAGSADRSTTVTAKFESGKRYRLERSAEGLSVVEDGSRP